MTITLAAGETRQLNVALTPLPPEPARLYGYVTDAAMAQPISGALVELTGVVNYSDITDAAGYYDIIGIAPGSYTVRVSAAGYEDAYF